MAVSVIKTPHLVIKSDAVVAPRKYGNAIVSQ
jgi:hypothetical protein